MKNRMKGGGTFSDLYNRLRGKPSTELNKNDLVNSDEKTVDNEIMDIGNILDNTNKRLSDVKAKLDSTKTNQTAEVSKLKKDYDDAVEKLNKLSSVNITDDQKIENMQKILSSAIAIAKSTKLDDTLAFNNSQSSSKALNENPQIVNADAKFNDPLEITHVNTGNNVGGRSRKYKSTKSRRRSYKRLRRRKFKSRRK